MGRRSFAPAPLFAFFFSDVEGLSAAAAAAKEFWRAVPDCCREAGSDGGSQRRRHHYAAVSGACGVRELRNVRRVRLPSESQVEFGGDAAAHCRANRTLR